MRQWFGLTSTGASLSLLLMSIASADTFDECVRQTDPDLGIVACTTVIGDGERPEGELAAAYYNRGNAYLGQGDSELAVADYNEVIRIAPGFAEAYINRALSNSARGRYALAIEDFDRALELSERGSAYVGRGNARASLGDIEGAAQDYLSAIRLNPNDAAALMALAGLQQRVGANLQATQSYGRIVDLVSDFIPAHFGRAEAHFALENYEEARADYERVVLSSPNSLQARLGLGRALCRLEDTEGAATALAAAADLGAEQAMAVQRMLQQFDYYTAAIDGAFGPRSNAALEAYVADGCPVAPLDIVAALDSGSDAYDAGRHEEAVAIWRPLAEQGVSEAQRLLGLMYEAGHGVPRSYGNAALLYESAALQGNVRAQRYLAILYAQGLGVGQNAREAERWYRLAAEGGDVRAQRALAAMYRDGDDVATDRAEAIRWYRLAAEQGDLSAQLALGALLEATEGTPDELIEAYAWYDTASAQANSDDASGARERVEARLTPEQLAEAQAVSRELKDRIQPAAM